MAAGTRCVDLVVNKSLLDSNFEGYKLSLDSLPVYKVNLDSCLDEVQLTDEQYSFQHIKAFGLHNYLTLDIFHNNVVYYIDNAWRVIKVNTEKEKQIEKPESVLEIPEASNKRLAPGRLASSLHFPSEHLAALSDGAGTCHIISTGDRQQPGEWKILHSECPLPENVFFKLAHSRYVKGTDKFSLHLLLLHVVKNDKEEPKASAFHTALEWVTFTSADEISWKCERTRRLSGTSCPDYMCFDQSGSCLLLSSQKPFKFEYDSVVPVVEETQKNEVQGPAYVWYQEDEDVTVQFKVPSGATKKDIEFKLTAQTLDVGLTGEKSLLTGVLDSTVDVSASTWTIANEKLEVVLNKVSEGRWGTVVKGDERGEMVVDPKSAAEIHEKLAPYTSENWNADADNGSKAYNSQELEECDAFPDDTAVMLRFDGETHQVTHQVNVGSHQWLFNCQVDPQKPPSVCLRHDVDGVLWQPKEKVAEKESPWEHTATFHALGYVQASKTQRKFGGCAPDFNYACIVDSVRHAYIYRQPSQILSPLRNRKTGKEVQAVSKQQLITLESVENIMGFQCSNDSIYLIAGRVLYVAKVNEAVVE